METELQKQHTVSPQASDLKEVGKKGLKCLSPVPCISVAENFSEKI